MADTPQFLQQSCKFCGSKVVATTEGTKERFPEGGIAGGVGRDFDFGFGTHGGSTSSSSEEEDKRSASTETASSRLDSFFLSVVASAVAFAFVVRLVKNETFTAPADLFGFAFAVDFLFCFTFPTEGDSGRFGGVIRSFIGVDFDSCEARREDRRGFADGSDVSDCCEGGLVG